MNTQTEAERLADTLDVEIFVTMEDLKQAAAELRRLETVNTELQSEILEQCRINGMGADREDALRAEVERLKKAVADEREAIMDEWWMCVQSDLENGVKSLNERAAEKWKKEYPAIAGFAEEIKERENT